MNLTCKRIGARDEVEGNIFQCSASVGWEHWLHPRRAWRSLVICRFHVLCKLYIYNSLYQTRMLFMPVSLPVVHCDLYGHSTARGRRALIRIVTSHGNAKP